jgi:hypothetical protein
LLKRFFIRKAEIPAPDRRGVEDGAMRLGCIHEFTGKGRDQEAAARGFLIRYSLADTPRSGIIWIIKRKMVFPPRLANFGLTPDRIIFLELAAAPVFNFGWYLIETTVPILGIFRLLVS